MVHGEWMTEAEAAERLGRARITIQQWRYKHKHADGSAALLEEAWDYYSDVNAGLIRLHNGQPPKHKLRGRTMPVREAAEMLGIPAGTLYSNMSLYSCELDAAYRYYNEKRQRKAEKKILEIIRGK